MPLYVGDYLADTMHLTAAQHGAYMLLLMHYWRSGPLPDDDDSLAMIARTDRGEWAAKIGPTIRAFFRLHGGKLHQKRSDHEIAKASGITTVRSKAGRAGAEKRWHKNDTAIADAPKQDGTITAEPLANASQTDAPLQPHLQKKETSLRDEKKGCRLPDDWTPGQEGADFARGLGLNPKAVFAVFRDYWHAKAGKDAVKLDWLKTWQNWCRREAERVGSKKGPDLLGGPTPLSGGF